MLTYEEANVVIESKFTHHLEIKPECKNKRKKSVVRNKICTSS